MLLKKLSLHCNILFCQLQLMCFFAGWSGECLSWGQEGWNFWTKATLNDINFLPCSLRPKILNARRHQVCPTVPWSKEISMGCGSSTEKVSPNHAGAPGPHPVHQGGAPTQPKQNHQREPWQPESEIDYEQVGGATSPKTGSLQNTSCFPSTGCQHTPWHR